VISDFDPYRPPTHREASFRIGAEGFLAEVESPEAWSNQDWSRLVIAVLRTAQVHRGGRLPHVDEDILAALRKAEP
jgi:hypothetical protein